MKTKKLLFIGAYPLPYGGIASHLYELLPQLVKRGYEVVSLTPSVDDKIIRSTRMKNIFINIKKYFFRNPLPVLLIFVRAFQCKKDLGWKEFIKVIGFSRAITTIMLEENIDAVFVYDNYNGLVIPLLKEHFKVSPQIAFMIFGDLYLFPDKYKAISGYLKSVFIHCDIILASSRYCGDSIAKVLGYKTAVKVIYIGVDQTLYAPAKTGVPMRVELAIPPFATVFLFLARMTESMGLDFILQNAQHLLRIHQNIYLILAGAQ
ncbi:MAG: glycosyltransferase, partial [Candidatus Nealsonbacteria bacterium]|nr:glycosyltransferase [Candidatus Nealsonbacteria bacterium]